MFTNIEEVIEAKQHGEDSEPDHEVGDLQELLREAFELLTVEDRQKFFSSQAVADIWNSVNGE